MQCCDERSARTRQSEQQNLGCTWMQKPRPRAQTNAHAHSCNWGPRHWHSSSWMSAVYTLAVRCQVMGSPPVSVSSTRPEWSSFRIFEQFTHWIPCPDKAFICKWSFIRCSMTGERMKLGEDQGVANSQWTGANGKQAWGQSGMEIGSRVGSWLLFGLLNWLSLLSFALLGCTPYSFAFSDNSCKW